MMQRTTRTATKCYAITTALILVVAGGSLRAAADRNTSCPYFEIHVVDRQTGRGVPLVELKTTNNIRYYTDSNGIVAFCEPGLMDREVFFHVRSHGYEFPKDGFGYRGVRLKTTPGTTATIRIDRVNIAERLYRVTGQGIYRDSILVDCLVPLKNPVLNGQVTGQDSVYTCLYHGRLFWMWGDTGRPSYPLGHFGTAAALSELPDNGGLDPSVGVDLDYYIDNSGFSRPVAKMSEPGMVWLDGLLTVQNPAGQQRMIARFTRMKDLGHAYEQGLMLFNDRTESFEPIVRSPSCLLPHTDPGHAFPVRLKDQDYYYFAVQFPLTVRMRVKAQWADVTDPNRYEAFTALEAGGSEPGQAYRWVRLTDLMNNDTSKRASVIEALKKEKEPTWLYDVESGQRVSPHGGSVHFNAYRQRWIMIVVQVHGDSSYLGEVWYAEADTPTGPWAYARKIVTHDKYSFYNPKQHPLFDQDGGRTIYFEGTYSHTFSGSEETATPRYDYNQIMYRLNLDDPRLTLPVPVYHLQGNTYRLGREGVASIPFFAVEPDRAGGDLIAVYAQNGPAAHLTTDRPEESATPLFLAMPPTESASDNACVVDLYEYSNAESGQVLYKTDPQWHEAGWKRADKPLCRVWKTPPGPLLLDPQAGPAGVP